MRAAAPTDVSKSQVLTPQLDRLETFLEKTYLSNPSVRAARFELRAIEERLPQAKSHWFPSISVDGNITSRWYDGDIYSTDHLTTKAVGGDINEALYRGGRTAAEQKSARNAVAGQGMILQSFIQDMFYDVAAAYMNVTRDQSILDLRQNNYDLLARQLDFANNRFSAGEITKTDVAQSQARLARADADRVSATGDLASSRAEFQRLSGLMLVNPGVPYLEFPIPDTLDKAHALAEQNNPRILAADYFHESSQHDVEKIFGERLPEIGLFGTWDREYDPYPGQFDEATTSAIGIRAKIDLYKGGATRSRQRQAQAFANQRYMEILESKRLVHEQVSSAWANLQAARAEIRSREAQVEAAQIARDGVKKEEELGNRTILDTLDSDQEYLDARTALAVSRRDEVVATFALARALGLLTPATLGFSALEEEIEPDYEKYSENRADKSGD